jgi:hypothetical protein
MQHAIPDEDNAFSFKGQILSHALTWQEALTSGQYLILRDSHVRSLMNGNTLLNYVVKIKY